MLRVTQRSLLRSRVVFRPSLLVRFNTSETNPQAPFLNYALRQKENEMKKKLNHPVPEIKEAEIDYFSEDNVDHIDEAEYMKREALKKVDTSPAQIVQEEEEEEQVEELFEEEIDEGICSIEDEKKHISENYTQAERDFAASTYIKKEGIEETEKLLAEVTKSMGLGGTDKTEKDHPLKAMEEDQFKVAEKVIQTDFRDTTKLILKIIGEFQEEPLRIYKTLKEEQLGQYLDNTTVYQIFKVFASYSNSRQLLPELLQWVKGSVTCELHPRIYDYAIREMVNQGLGEDAVAELNGLEEKGIKPMPTSRKAISVLYASRLMEKCKQGELDEVRNLLRWLRFTRVYTETKAYHFIVETYTSHNLLHQARDVLAKMALDGELAEKKYYAKIIGIYCERGDFGEANMVLHEMDSAGVYAPRSLTETVLIGIRKSNDAFLKKDAEQAAKFRVNWKALQRNVNETWAV